MTQVTALSARREARAVAAREWRGAALGLNMRERATIRRVHVGRYSYDPTGARDGGELWTVRCQCGWSMNATALGACNDFHDDHVRSVLDCAAADKRAAGDEARSARINATIERALEDGHELARERFSVVPR